MKLFLPVSTAAGLRTLDPAANDRAHDESSDSPRCFDMDVKNLSSNWKKLQATLKNDPKPQAAAVPRPHSTKRKCPADEATQLSSKRAKPTRHTRMASSMVEQKNTQEVQAKSVTVLGVTATDKVGDHINAGLSPSLVTSRA